MFQIVGVIGSIIVIYSYFMTAVHLLDPKSYKYNIINIIAAFLMLVSLYEKPNLGSIIIEGFLIIISIIGILKVKYVNK